MPEEVTGIDRVIVHDMEAGDICPACESIGLPGALCPKHAGATRKPPVRTDADYIALDEAMTTMQKWEREIVDELAKKGLSWKNFRETLAAMLRVHSPEE